MQVSNFSSVKLSSDLVQQARDAAQPLRRSAAGQIEYWATLGRVVEHSGLTELEAREAIENYEASARVERSEQRLTQAKPDTLDAIKRRVLAASSDGALQAQIRHVVANNSQKADRNKIA